jgi:hypothetical protein
MLRLHLLQTNITLTQTLVASQEVKFLNDIPSFKSVPGGVEGGIGSGSESPGG